MGSIPIRVTDRQNSQPSGGTGRRATLRTSCPLWACEFDSRLGYFDIAGAAGVQSAFIRPMCPARYRDLQPNAGEPALILVSYARTAGCDSRTRYLLWPGTQIGKAATSRAWRCCGFDPHLGHYLVPWSNGYDACVTCRKLLVQFQPGSSRPITVISIPKVVVVDSSLDLSGNGPRESECVTDKT